MNRYLRKIIIGVFIAPLLGFLYILGVIYLYDPLQLFSEKYPNKYVEETRLAAKRVIDNYNFDGIYLGTSMLLMSNPKELKSGKYINITLNSSTIKERSSVLKYLFYKNKNVKNIIYTYDIVNDSFGAYGKDLSLLYKNNLSFVEKIKFYSRGYIDYKCFLTLSKDSKCIGREHDYYDIQMEFSRPDYIINENDFILEHNQFKATNEKLLLEKYLIKYIKNNPKTIFHIVIPPYHTLYFKKNLYLITLYKLGIQELSQYKNVKIYYFGNEAFCDNMNNYQNDKYHYKKHINSRINRAINEGTNIIMPQNMDEYFERFIKKVKNYDIKAYEEALKLDIRE